ncbi:MAG: F0F1 ATP synthase subunit A [Eubacterium sp.]|nr:F0F1 ATP synthase subunit A [Eubacterium sp.]
MSKKTRSISIVVFVVAFAAMLAGVFLTPTAAKHESIQETMRDAVLHGSNKISLFGLKEVNPGLISAFTVTAIIFVFALIVRIFVIPRFKMVPGKFQLLLEEAVGLFEGLAKSNSPHRNGCLGAYIFTAGVYIFIGTLFELFGVQAVTTAGHTISLPAPLSDINGAICLGVLSYCIILSGGIIGNGLKGVGQTLKDFSLPISMSFRLFGALLSGALVTELVYYYFNLSIGLPVFVGVMFTLLHALIQAYVLTMLTSLFYGEVSEKHEKKPKVKKKKQETTISEVSAS